MQPEEKLILWSAEDQEQRRRERAVEYLISASGPLGLPDSSREEREGWLVKWWDLRAQLVRAIKSKEDLKKCGVSESKNRLLLFGEAAGLCAIVGWAPLGLPNGCKVCAQGGHTRRVFRNYIRVQDDMPGRTWA